MCVEHYIVGPLSFDAANSTGNKPQLKLNPYSWTKVQTLYFPSLKLVVLCLWYSELNNWKISGGQHYILRCTCGHWLLVCKNLGRIQQHEWHIISCRDLRIFQKGELSYCSHLFLASWLKLLWLVDYGGCTLLLPSYIFVLQCCGAVAYGSPQIPRKSTLCCRRFLFGHYSSYCRSRNIWW